MIKFFLLLILSLVMLNADVEAQKKSDSEILVTIARGACFGSCPIYTARIYTDGTVIYKGEDFVKVKGEKTHKITPEKVKKLIKAFADVDYFSLKDKYETDEDGTSITDQPTTITSITLDGKKKEVVNYYSAPKKLEELENAVEKIADLDQYIGPL